MKYLVLVVGLYKFADLRLNATGVFVAKALNPSTCKGLKGADMLEMRLLDPNKLELTITIFPRCRNDGNGWQFGFDDIDNITYEGVKEQ